VVVVEQLIMLLEITFLLAEQVEEVVVVTVHLQQVVVELELQILVVEAVVDLAHKMAAQVVKV
jgi:hypothetical protein